MANKSITGWEVKREENGTWSAYLHGVRIAVNCKSSNDAKGTLLDILCGMGVSK
jgi:hypothetical protein